MRDNQVPKGTNLKESRRYRTDIAAERLRDVLSYCQHTGEFRWKIAHTRTSIGKVAGHIDTRGYRFIGIDGKLYRAHRLAFLYMTGKFPDLDVDHKDGDQSNNRWDNLREATVSQNMANCRRHRHNTSGLKGVTWYANSRKWGAQIVVNDAHKWLGLFETPEAAHDAYIAAATKYFGEFASNGVREIDRELMFVPSKGVSV